MAILNFELLKHPMNWVTVFLMVFVVVVAAALITGHYKAVSTHL